MGCDGGTIPRRDELVKTKKKKEEKDRDAELAAKWQFCALSCTKLNRPIVACDLGRLYNKDSIIEFLLNRDTFPGDVATHIRTLKDVTELNLTEKKDFDDKAGKGGEYVDTQNSRFICPVVGLEMSGKYKFYYIRGCGCVLSERAIKEVKSEACHNCGKEFSPDQDLVVLNGSDDEVVDLRRKMEERRALAKSERKGKKRKAVAAAAGSAAVAESTSHSSTDAAADTDAQKKAKNSSSSTAGPSRSTQQPTASKKSTTKTSTMALLSDKASDKYSVAKDPNASETYKSIFTSHESAKNRPKAHWVTFNPLFN